MFADKNSFLLQGLQRCVRAWFFSGDSGGFAGRLMIGDIMALKMRWVGVALVAASLSGCGGIYDPEGAYLAISGEHATAAQTAVTIADMENYVRAEQMADSILKRQPNNPLALLAQGIVYENTGRTEWAKQNYRSIISNNPNVMVMISDGDNVRRRWVVEVAQEHLAALDKGAVRPSAANRAAAQSSSAAMQTSISNVTSRFITLKKALDEGLITPAEYQERRDANLGALLPNTHKTPPAIGLDRPAPSTAQVLGRLRALAGYYKEGGISSSDYARERNTILDGVLPTSAAKRAPMEPLTEAQAQMLRGELLRAQDADVLTEEEVDREKAAMNASPRAGSPSTSAGTPSSPSSPLATPVSSSRSPQPLVGRASTPAKPVAAPARAAAPARSAAPARAPAKPVAAPAKPVAAPAKPVAASARAAEASARSAEASARSAEESAKSAGMSAQSAEQSAKAAGGSAQSAEQSAKAAEGAAKPADIPAKPDDASSKPADVSAKPSDVSAKPVVSHAASNASRSWRAQFSVVGNQAEADAVWNALQRKYPAQLGSLKLDTEISKGAYGGTTYSIHAGPLADQAAAEALCAALQAKKEHCVPVPPVAK